MNRIVARLRGQQDLAVGVVLALLGAVSVVLDLPAAVRLPLTVPLAIFLPGFALLSALVPSSNLAAVERVMISIGASIGVTIIGGIVLALSPVRLSPASWSLMLAAVSITGLTVAWVRRSQAGISGPRFNRPAVPLGAAVLLLVASVLLADVLLGARFIAAEQLTPPPAQLWMLPTQESQRVLVGMQAGPGGGDYVVRVSSAGEAVAEYELELAQTQQWQTELTVTAEQRAGPLVARLYEGDSAIELRFVVLQPATTGD